ncbi:acetate/propionate family kinase [Ruegeria pomeroyi]|uniref:Acetate kinase n=2 Tax=Ruegeria pomeroyi TaxID=89184 RepID=Q5LWR6_RUEPO|nr:acetate/propionate family kinase [Ruegeria pomeroyi]HCE71555.1 acetate/propionate family kinase [Ruegeria sp.]AAV93446.1 acetate kinase [Ruegeria pomeroyi DSS-3]NVK99076.1 acetate/propionate family kinase [Ruegeria pomeroyi]NVL03919.1 acetate/propionate family kinase [Ruegeria pomeroyi]QWV10740.1 acetate/propionate family kinase [Ruegeria pomeroyi]
MTDVVLVLNAGSSSIKFAVYPSGTNTVPLIRGKVAGVGRDPVFSAVRADGTAIDMVMPKNIDAAADHEALISLLLDWLAEHRADRRLVAVGHRVVHGGRDFLKPVIVDDSVLSQLEQLIPLAPLHQPHNLAAIRAISRLQPTVPQVACFDTSFHQTQDRLAQLFALPRDLSDEGIIRYGFHGLSYEYIAGILPDHLGERAEGRVIVAHLGNGASMCAMKNRQSVATSMGFTALDGLMMGRRCGALDAGVVLYLMQSKGLNATEIETLLYRRCGLLGVSGISNNMRELERSDDPKAREAIELFCFRAASVLGGLVTALGGLDAIVFTAGIGENSALVRKLICDRLACFGVDLDPNSNEGNSPRIGSVQSSIDVLVLPTDEEIVISNATNETVALG